MGLALTVFLAFLGVCFLLLIVTLGAVVLLAVKYDQIAPYARDEDSGYEGYGGSA